MTIQSIKTYLYDTATSIKQGTPYFLDRMCMDAFGKPYLYAVRPLAIGLHGYFRTNDNGPNIAYNALGLAGGTFVANLSPVRFVVNIASACTDRIASFAFAQIRKLPLPAVVQETIDGVGQETTEILSDAVQVYNPKAQLPKGTLMENLVPLLASGYLQFRISHLFTRVLPYKVASHFTDIRRKPRFAPNRAETFAWLMSALFIAFTKLLPAIERRRQIQIQIKRAIEAQRAKAHAELHPPKKTWWGKSPPKTARPTSLSNRSKRS